MARHSHWANIKNKKAASDAIRGKALTLHAKLIEVAARKGGNPDMNAALRSAIDKAKSDNVPNANIERAIRRGTGEDKDGKVYEELTYEAFGPEGCVFLIDVITDNKNRSLTNIRTNLEKKGGHFGAAGSVAWKFDKKAYFEVRDSSGSSPDEVELKLIDCGSEDLIAVDGGYEVYTAPEKLGEVKNALIKAGFKVEKDELVWKAKDEVRINNVETGKKILEMIESVEVDEDVKVITSNVYMDFPSEMFSAVLRT